MNFIFNTLSELILSVAREASTHCVLVFFEPEMPKSLREE